MHSFDCSAVRRFWRRLGQVTLLLTPILGLGVEQPLPSDTAKPVDYMIVVTGEELLRGVYPDAHTCFLTRTLRPLGCRCVGSVIVDDSDADLKEALRQAAKRVPLVITTGGLGPTVNDITRETLAQFTGIKLQEHPDLLGDLERRFNQPREQLRPNLRRQTLTPLRGRYLRNPLGTAAGLVFEMEATTFVALPGPPRELQPIVTNEVIPYLLQKFGARSVGSSLTLRFVGLGQSLIDQTIRDHVRLPPDVVVSSLFEGTRVDFSFALPGNTPEDQEKLARLGAQVRERLGDSIYADDGSTLEQTVARALLARAASLVLVEVGSGGALASSLSSLSHRSQLLTAAYVAPTDDRMRATLQIPSDSWMAWKTGAEKVKGMALAAERLTGARWTIAVGQVTTDDAGTPGVWAAFGWPEDHWETRRFPLRDSGEISRATLATQLWDCLRRGVSSY